MNSQFKKLIDYFDEQPIRIRVIMTFASIAILIFIFDLIFLSDAFNKDKKIKRENSLLNKNLSQLTTNLNEINSGIISQKSNPLKKQLDRINQDIIKTKSELDKKTIHLVKPEDMLAVLKEILSHSKNLKIISLKQSTPQALFESNQPLLEESVFSISKNTKLVSSKERTPKSTEDSQQSPQVYRHPVEIILEGSYIETQKFIAKLESTPQKVNFESLQYAVQTYPTSKITLVVSTLSLSRKWIGG